MKVNESKRKCNDDEFCHTWTHGPYLTHI